MLDICFIPAFFIVVNFLITNLFKLCGVIPLDIAMI